MTNLNNNDSFQELDILEKFYHFIIPKFQEAHDIMVSMIDFPAENEIKIADLGFGFGHLAQRALTLYPSSVVLAVEKNKMILQRGRERLNEFKERIVPVETDISTDNWDTDINEIDVLLSSFTLDFLPFEQHQNIIKHVNSLLTPQGRWITCEFFRSEDNQVNRVFHDLEIQFIQRALIDGHITKEQIEILSNSHILRKDHHVCTIDEKVSWLKQAGYQTIEVPWKFLNLAIISAVKE